jgi:predicted Rossmann-fold nucleotide-binding protein
MRAMLVGEGMIDAGDIDLMHLVDDSDAVVDAIFNFYEKRGFATTAVEREQLLYL